MMWIAICAKEHKWLKKHFKTALWPRLNPERPAADLKEAYNYKMDDDIKVIVCFLKYLA